jgi:serralysin
MDESTRRQIRTCIDRKVAPKPVKERMALVRASLWPARAGIRAVFLDGDSSLRERVQSVAAGWFNHAKLTLYFVTDAQEASIRISFAEPGSSWSYVGTDCHSVSDGKATMNFGWLSPTSPDDELRRVVLHEFGHALGCVHEHQNPAGGIAWNKPAAYEYYGGPPNYWSKGKVDSNVFDAYDANLTVHSRVDADSIMMYPIPRDLTLDKFEVGLNTQLSALDIEFIKKVYP